MDIYLSKESDIFKNIAIDEALLYHQKVEQDILLISQTSRKSIVIGRNQNIYKIINHDFIEKKGIVITRRLSGGGAIYQDKGTVAFSFISNKPSHMLNEVLKPIYNFLKSINLDVRLKGKNIYVGDKKISLITEYHYNDNILYRGILLFNSDLKMLYKSLTDPKHVHETRLTNHPDAMNATNIKDILKTNWTTKTFIIQLINFYQKNNHKILSIPKPVLDKANKIWLKTSSHEWVYGPWPDFMAHNTQQFPQGILEVKYNHENGKIKKIKIYGDFNSNKDTKKIEDLLINVSLKKSSLLRALGPLKAAHYFGKISKINVVKTILGNS